MNKFFKFATMPLLIGCLLISIKSVSSDEDTQIPEINLRGNVTHVEVDWSAIKMNSKWASSEMIIDGFISVEGIKYSPRISLWETEESMKHKRVFRSILIDSENAMEIIGPDLGWTPEGWGVLHGAFVKITCSFEREQEGLEYITLGRLTNIKNISVYNSGQLLYEINRKSDGHANDPSQELPE